MSIDIKPFKMAFLVTQLIRLIFISVDLSSYRTDMFCLKSIILSDSRKNMGACRYDDS